MSAKTHPCVFGGSFIREQIDPRVQAIWQERWKKPARFGELRRLFRERHCRAVNPYGSQTCPYPEKDCAMSFLRAVEVSIDKSESSLGYYRAVCLSSGARRADEKPLARDREPRPGGPSHQPRPAPIVVQVGDGSTVSILGTAGEDAMRRRLSRPQRIGDLLGSHHDKSDIR